MPGQVPLLDGTTLLSGSYIIESHLAAGGFGITYRAREPGKNRVVAIKEFYPDGCTRSRKRLMAGGDWDDDYLDKYKNSFLREGNILKGFNHPGIVRFYDLFLENNTLYLVMEFIEGQTLSQYQRAYLRENQRQLPIDEALTLVRQAGEALSLAHRQNLLHRDLKPGNIMRRTNGQAVLIDFGAAREVLPDQEMSHSQIYTPGYAPPEQYPRLAVRGPHTDVYALAATLYKLLTGETPTESNIRPLMGMPEPRSVRPEVPKAVSEAVMWGMELRTSDRAQTVAAFLDALFPSPPAVKINPIDGAEMLLIPAGEFLMGTTEAEIEAILQAHPDWELELFEGEKPQRQVHLDHYYIYKTPVTVAQYRRFCEANQIPMPEPPDWGWHDNHPVVNVSWHDSKAYCEWAGVHLPTEAQWEKAARGTDGRLFPWGNEWDSGRCQCSKEWGWDAEGTCTVGSYPSGASPYEVLDMAGNVVEWCEDWYDEEHATRALRGGSWDLTIESFFRVSYRANYAPDLLNESHGFRACLV